MLLTPVWSMSGRLLGVRSCQLCLTLCEVSAKCTRVALQLPLSKAGAQSILAMDALEPFEEELDQAHGQQGGEIVMCDLCGASPSKDRATEMFGTPSFGEGPMVAQPMPNEHPSPSRQLKFHSSVDSC